MVLYNNNLLLQFLHHPGLISQLLLLLHVLLFLLRLLLLYHFLIVFIYLIPDIFDASNVSFSVDTASLGYNTILLGNALNIAISSNPICDGPSSPIDDPA